MAHVQHRDVTSVKKIFSMRTESLGQCPVSAQRIVVNASTMWNDTEFRNNNRKIVNLNV